MATFGFFASNKAQRKHEDDRNIRLIKHEATEHMSEYYSYINADGYEERYKGALTKKGDDYIGKSVVSHKVMLTYHPTVEHVDGVTAYYTYMDDNGNEIIYKGVPLYDEAEEKYVGTIDTVELRDKIVDIYLDTEE